MNTQCRKPACAVVENRELERGLTPNVADLKRLSVLVNMYHSHHVESESLASHLTDPCLCLQGVHNKANLHSTSKQSLQAVTSLGFSEEQALRALKNSQGNVERAVNWLLQ